MDPRTSPWRHLGCGAGLGGRVHTSWTDRHTKRSGRGCPVRVMSTLRQFLKSSSSKPRVARRLCLKGSTLEFCFTGAAGMVAARMV